MKALMAPVVVGLLLVAGAAIGRDSNQAPHTAASAEQPASPRIAGQCHCGSIRYEAAGPIIKCSSCDCRGCQRASGTLKATFVSVRRATFTVTGGQPAEFRAQSGDKCDRYGVWHFCPKCGTQVFWKADKGDEIDIFAGTLDDTKLFQPGE